MTVVETFRDYRTHQHTLSSGVVIDLSDFVANDLLTIDDCNEAMSLVQEKALQIEYQMDLYKEGYHADGEPFSPERPPTPMWVAKANKALAWTKINKNDITNRKERLSRIEHEKAQLARRRELAHMFLEVARNKLPRHEFAAMLLTANELVVGCSMEAAE
jgi:hypothetical protein